MLTLLKASYKEDKRGFIEIFILNIISSLMGGISIVVLLPMLELLEDVPSSLEGSVVEAAVSTMSPVMRVFVLAGGYLFLLTVKALLSRQMSLRQNAYLCHYTQRQRQTLYELMEKSSWQYLAKQKRTDLINLFTSLCGQVTSGISSSIGMLSNIVIAIVQLIIALCMSVPITLFVCVAGAVLMAVFWPLKKKSKAFGKEMIDVSRNFYSELLNQLGSVKEIRAYDVESEHEERFTKINEKFTTMQTEYAKVSSLPGLVYNIAAALVIALLFVFSTMGIHIETARLLVLVLVFSRLWPIFSGFQGTVQSIQTNLPALEDLEKAMREMREAREEPDDGRTLDFKENVTFDGVHFSYFDDGKDVLGNMSFEIKFGEIVALCGRSGAGKSTVANLLMGFLNPTSGSISVDGSVLTGKDLHAWRRVIGYVPQDPLVLNASVRENLSRFHPNVTEEEMIDALKRAQAWGFVEKLNDGLDTLLGDQGVRLSGGERQRIILARVLLGKPRFIILDEATSALDYDSEISIRNVLYELKGEVSVLIIAHRLATIRIADKALVLENGSISETGTIAELIKKPGGYLNCMADLG